MQICVSNSLSARLDSDSFNSFHDTADNTLDYPNLAEQIKEWSNVLGVTFTKNVTNNPQSGYTQMLYGNRSTLAGYSAHGADNTVSIHESIGLAWFGIA
jgi:acetylxylan esterase